MFSGIVEVVGRIRAVDRRDGAWSIRVEVPSFASELSVGDSVAVDGACLTVTHVHSDGFSVDVIGTTLERTIADSYEEGTDVNLERALRLGSRLDGHLVQGHVDGIGHVMDHMKDGSFWIMDFSLPPQIHAETIEHGSVTLNGVSLTVSELLPDHGVRIGVIPHTHAHTNLGTLGSGDPVNVEGDVIGKYVARILAQSGP
jgi:riboflavin synthase